MIWLSPLALFLGLILIGRPPLLAGLAGTLAAAFVTWHSGPAKSDPARIFDAFLGGMWIALPAVLVILAGLAFAKSIEASEVEMPVSTRNHGQVAQICFLVGPFMETVAGFGVGYVVAVMGLRRLGVKAAHALALAAFSQCLVPWGALGIGTRISAELAAVDLRDVAWRLAVIVALLWLALVPLFWRLASQAGFAPSAKDRIEWALLFALLLVLLVLANWALPVELAAIAALGNVMSVHFLRSYGLKGLDRALLRRLAPFLALIAALAAMQLWPALRTSLSSPSFKPFFELPALAPFLSPALPLLVVALVVSLMRSGVGGALTALNAAAVRGWKASLLTFLLVGMAYILVRGGVAHHLMSAASESLELWAVGLVPLAGAGGGYLTGSNTGAGALSMPLANAMDMKMAARHIVVAAAIAAGSLMTAVSPVRLAMGLAISGAGPAEGRAALGLLAPFVMIVLFLTAIIAMAASIAL
jgi:lactate permease